MAEPHRLDVRQELRRGGEPLASILKAVDALAPGQPLLLITPFEPLPLYAVLARKGFIHTAIRQPAGHWEVLFAPASAPNTPASSAATTAPQSGTDTWPAPSVLLDNRGLQPPEPMVRILAALERLGPGQVIEALNERDPLFLYPELQTRGAAIRTETVAAGVRLLIRRAG